MSKRVRKSHVKSNIGSNILIITYAEIITEKDLSSLYTDIRFFVEDLKPGFFIIGDFSATSVMHVSATLVFRKIFKFLMQKRFSEIVRVIPENKLLNCQFLNFTARTHCYSTKVEPTIEEAQEHIERSIRRRDVRLLVNHSPVRFTFDGETGSGTLYDISLGGCAVHSSYSSLLETGHSLAVEFTLPSKKKEKGAHFKLDGEVVRKDDQGFALQFSEQTSQDTTDLLHEILVELTGEDIHQSKQP